MSGKTGADEDLLRWGLEKWKKKVYGSIYTVCQNRRLDNSGRGHSLSLQALIGRLYDLKTTRNGASLKYTYSTDPANEAYSRNVLLQGGGTVEDCYKIKRTRLMPYFLVGV